MKSGVSLITTAAHTRLHGKEIVMRRLITIALILMVLPLSGVAQPNTPVESEESNVIDTLDQSPEGLLTYNYVFHTPQIARVHGVKGRGYVGPAYTPVGVPPNGVTSLLSESARREIERKMPTTPEVKEGEFLPVDIQHKRYDRILRKIHPSVQAEQSASRTAFHNAPSPYWSMTTGPQISEEKAGAWEDELMLRDDANVNVIADAIDTSKLKIAYSGPIGLANGYTNLVPIKAYLTEQKAKGYNAVLIDWLTGSIMSPSKLIDFVDWANGEFDTVIIAPVPSSYSKHILQSKAETFTTLNTLLDKADAVLLGWNFTVDTVLYGDEGSKEFCTRFFRAVEVKASAKNVPVWGFLFTRFHGSNRKYQYTPQNLTAYVCGHIIPAGRQTLIPKPEQVIAKAVANGVPEGKPIILGPIQTGNIDRKVKIYNSMGFGAIKVERIR
jgi:hypothetical protein